MLVFRCILTVDNSLSEILLGELSHGVGSSLSVDHDAEAFEVGQVSSGSLLGNLQEGSAFLPLLLQVISSSSLSVNSKKISQYIVLTDNKLSYLMVLVRAPLRTGNLYLVRVSLLRG